MREIKFRAWDKTHKTMISKHSFAINFNPIDDKEFHGKTIRLGYHKDLYVLMQYTGLKDIDKKELYDGDFFKDDEGMLYLIEWDAGGLQWYAVDVLNNGEWSMNLGEFINTRIVYQGNKFENPELLTSQQGSGKAG